MKRGYTLQQSHDRLFGELKGLIKCIRNFELGDFSPLMDEIFDSEDALKKGKRFTAKTKRISAGRSGLVNLESRPPAKVSGQPSTLEIK